MFQNHLFQLLCLTAMEPPVALTADAVRDEKVKVLRSIQPILPREVFDIAVRGQYGRGTIDGMEVKAYREEPGVAHDSPTETYAAVELFIDNWRWEGVPFYLRSGKRLPKKLTEIVIQFKRPPLLLFRAYPVEQVSPNVLILSIQPNEGISLTFEVKPPGPEICVTSLSLDFNYETAFRSAPPDAYETLLVDCMRGDSTLFTRHDWIELSWSLMTPLLQNWAERKPQGFPNYEAGTWGPKEADLLIERERRRWRCP
jgi:glucose-6-phosphate 1-dehydrogenase